MQVRVNVVIEPSGKVSRARVQAPYDSSALGRCLAEVTRALRFPASRRGVSTQHRFTF
jgi:TonB family protein